MKKFLALLLTVVTAFAFSSVLTACKPEEPAGPQGTPGLIYELEIRGVRVTGIDMEAVPEGTTELVIPKTFNDADGKPVNVFAIGENAFNANVYDNLPFTSISLPNTLQEIGLYAFAGIQCESITLPASLKIISIGAFEGAALTSVVFKNTDGWMYHQYEYDQIQQDGILLAHPIVNIDISNPAIAASYLTTADEDFDYSKACEGSVTPTPVAGRQPTGLAWLTLYKK